MDSYSANLHPRENVFGKLVTVWIKLLFSALDRSVSLPHMYKVVTQAHDP